MKNKKSKGARKGFEVRNRKFFLYFFIKKVAVIGQAVLGYRAHTAGGSPKYVWRHEQSYKVDGFTAG